MSNKESRLTNDLPHITFLYLIQILENFVTVNDTIGRSQPSEDSMNDHDEE